MLLAAGANVNAREKTDAVPLYIAASKGHLNIVRLLLKAGTAVGSKKEGQVC